MTDQTQVSAELSEEQAEAMARAHFLDAYDEGQGGPQFWRSMSPVERASCLSRVRAAYAASPAPAMAAKLSAAEALIAELRADHDENFAGKIVMSEQAFNDLHGKAAKLSALEEGLEGLRALSEKTPAGPWRMVPWHVEEDMAAVRVADGWVMCRTSSDDYAAFIVAAVNLVRTLLTKEQTRG